MTADRGLRIGLHGGRSIGSFAYGQSLLGELLHHPRSARAAREISRFVESSPPSGEPVDPLVTVLRVREIACAVGLGLLLVAGAVVINAG